MMKFRTFSAGCECACEELNAFLAAHRIVKVERLFESGAWHFLVEYDERESVAVGRAGKGPKVDYREVLSEEDFAVFVRLRDVRKRLAEREGAAVFAVATNEQLAQFVKERAASLAALQAVSGFGPARAEKYGEAFLAVLREAFAEEGEK